MRAVVKVRPEPGVEVLDVPVPEIGEGNALIRVEAAAICGSDLGIYDYTPAYSGMRLPVVLGHEFSGRLEDVGPDVVDYEAGDRVLSESVRACGVCRFCREGMSNLCDESTLFGIHADGGFAEYVAVPHGLLHRIPDGVSYGEAALVEPLSNAVHFVGDVTPVRLGEYAVVHGPGPIGLFSAQLLRMAGVTVIITGIGVDANRFEIAARLGFETVNVEEEDPINRVLENTGGKGADVAFIATGAPEAVAQAVRIVRKRGHVTVVGIFPRRVEVPATSIVRREITLAGAYDARPANFEQAIGLIASGRIDAAGLITHRFPLEEAEKAFEVAKSRVGCKVLFVP